MIKSTFATWFWIWIFCVQHITGGDESNSDCSNENSNWNESVEEYPLLINFFRNRTGDELKKGSNTLKFINWQDHVLRLTCPGTDINGKVKKWKLNYFSDLKNKKTEEREEKFEKSEYIDWQLIVDAPIAFEYFATYSCLTLDDCWHNFYLVSLPAPRTTFPIQISTGETKSFSCWARSRISADGFEEFPINTPLQNITWNFPNDNRPENVQITVSSRTLNGVTSLWESNITVTEASDLNSGIHECVIVDKFGVSSSPEKLESGIYLISGERYKGVAHVHVRDLSYSLIPLGILVAQFLIIPVLVRFCPTAKGEADLEEDDPKPVRAKLTSTSSSVGNNDMELEEQHRKSK